ncbi:oligoribonuclease [Legionella shakespearei]|uniref:Oligoribonuclease n=1 Tax=Legionella shakespearei DSM 23087 TaxID=1122169 RepID=A0A0W0YSP0_9GAMM|nr:oligoribonuclease [Legionella shakespearei]KTD59931.1 oligoribonuclease [Legionella shakespearei DSM 23087]
MKNNHNLIWIDLEMTGLEPEQDRIIEIATIVTDPHLNILAEGPVIAVSQPQSLIDGMDAWNTRQHNQSGLVKRVLESQVGESEAEQLTIDFLKQYLDKGKSPMCGNSICQDRRFLYKYMPELAAFFHYRNLDVSTLKELAIRWHPTLLNGLTKESKHLALDDIKDSINELVYYRQHFINLPEVKE